MSTQARAESPNHPGQVWRSTHELSPELLGPWSGTSPSIPKMLQGAPPHSFAVHSSPSYVSPGPLFTDNWNWIEHCPNRAQQLWGCACTATPRHSPARTQQGVAIKAKCGLTSLLLHITPTGVYTFRLSNCHLSQWFPKPKVLHLRFTHQPCPRRTGVSS
jgi:hypothetical protein